MSTAPKVVISTLLDVMKRLKVKHGLLRQIDVDKGHEFNSNMLD